MNAPDENPAPVGWVLYDGSCGFCREWVPFWAPAMRRRGIEIAPLQAEWVREKLGLAPDETLRDIRLLFSDGRQVSGPDVYREVMRRIGWARPFYLLSRAPGLRAVFDRCYRLFAKNRHRISRACGLEKLA
jgi:predicted DCC family thiol-disulfide oxidoreductase YuxK